MPEKSNTVPILVPVKKIGKYEIRRVQIGNGGGGVVHEGYDPDLHRRVAIKVLHALVPLSARAIPRFEREARITAKLDHPNIIKVYTFESKSEVGPYLVQEYVEGEDLEDKISNSYLNTLTKLKYLLEIANGLAYAHNLGIVHRDIKPPNIRINKLDHVKIMDFGIAKLLTETGNPTDTGLVVGTPGYLAPEQILRQTLDHRTDIFSFGVVAYELISQVQPFIADTMEATNQKTLDTEPRPLEQLYPSCPPDIAELVHRCLQKDPERRYPSFGAVVPLLSEAIERDRRFPASLSSVEAEPETGPDEKPSQQGPARPAPGPQPVPPQVTSRKPTLRVSRAVWYLTAIAVGLFFATVVVTGPRFEPLADDSLRTAPRSVSRPEPAGEEPDPQPPPAPETGTALPRLEVGFELRQSTVYLYWQAPDPVAGGASYLITRQPPWTFGSEVYYQGSSASMTWVDDEELTPGHSYTYTVRALDPSDQVVARSEEIRISHQGE